MTVFKHNRNFHCAYCHHFKFFILWYLPRRKCKHDLILSATYAKDQSFLWKPWNVIWLVKKYSATENEIAALKELKIIPKANLIHHMKYRKKNTTQQNTITVAMDLFQKTMVEIAVYDLLAFLRNANIRFIISFFCKAPTFGILYLFYILRTLSKTCIFHQHIN